MEGGGLILGRKHKEASTIRYFGHYIDKPSKNTNNPEITLFLGIKCSFRVTFFDTGGGSDVRHDGHNPSKPLLKRNIVH